MDVSIIIVNYNTRELVQNCIDSIIEKTNGVEYEIIVVDNNSHDDSKEYLEKDSRITYIYSNVNLGFGRANNKGLEIIQGRNILLLNPDTLLLNNAVKILSDYLDQHLHVGCCGGNLYDAELNPVHSYSMMLPSVLWELNLLFANKIEKIRWGKNAQFNHTHIPRKVGYICGADMMLRHNVLKQIGAFSEHFFMYYEDTELSYRIKQSGYEILSIPEAKIQHLVGKSMGGKNFNAARVKFIEAGLSTFYALHARGVEKKIIRYLRLLRLKVKHLIYRGRFKHDLYQACKIIIKNDKVFYNPN